MWRPATEQEIDKYSYLVEELTKGDPHWEGKANKEDAVRAIKSNQILAAILNENVLFLYVVGSPWYNSQTQYLQEMGVYNLPIGEEGGLRGGFRSTVAAIEELALDHECSKIKVGAILPSNPEALARLYRRCGFHDSPPELYKDI